MPKVVIYSTPTCIWCYKTKEYLKKNEIKFVNKDITIDTKARDEMIKKSKQLGVPVLDIDGEIIVGYNEQAMKKAFKNK